MKQDKGITLITLIMYIILTLVVLGILGALSRNFRGNLNNVNSKTVQEVEYDKLNTQLLKETKTESNFIETATATKASITFANGNKYTYSDAEEAVFLNDNIKIAKNIKSCAFSVENTDTEQVLKVRTLIGDKGQIMEYVMKIWEHHDWHYIDETTRTQIRCTCARCKAFNDGDSTGRTLSVGQQIGETETKTASTSISGERSGVSQGLEDGNEFLDASKLGVNGRQTLELQAEETKWVVFGYEDKDNDGLNESLLLTTEHPTKNTINFYGAAAYNNAVEEINRMCKELYGLNARGITIEDINKVLGYTPGNLTTKLKDLGDTWTAIVNYNTSSESGIFYDPSHPEGISDNGAALGEYELNGYYYSEDDVETNISSIAKAMIFGKWSGNYAYWLASCVVNIENNKVSFGPLWLENGGINIENPSDLFWSVGWKRNYRTRLRPIISLTFEIPSGGEILEFDGDFYAEGQRE